MDKKIKIMVLCLFVIFVFVLLIALGYNNSDEKDIKILNQNITKIYSGRISQEEYDSFYELGSVYLEDDSLIIKTRISCNQKLNLKSVKKQDRKIIVNLLQEGLGSQCGSDFYRVELKMGFIVDVEDVVIYQRAVEDNYTLKVYPNNFFTKIENFCTDIFY